MKLDSIVWTEKMTKILSRSVQILIFILLLSIMLSSTNAVPTGPVFVSNTTETATPRAATQITTAGGSFTTLVINSTTQTPRWKAYVGNVTGRLVLDDSTNKSIYDWAVSSVTGEVYATRNSTIDWSTITCTNLTTVYAEESELNMSNSNPDTINKTFSYRIHRSFYVGSTLIANSTCPSVATYVNGSAQAITENAPFQEILLKDSASRMVYAAMINQNATGFDSGKYDFQMIVGENEYQQTPTSYYFYVELT